MAEGVKSKRNDEICCTNGMMRLGRVQSSFNGVFKPCQCGYCSRLRVHA
ncbi:uncharacterized protein G2W53_018662 [Senna tora]|uniref:Uncharacterized protein n=1 Tax=Senna tora TaxID=362788 RepID=A0A834TSL2_9FABA|nr:uncharacterized protein G2W53_018662 [Senna tora]